MASHERIVPPAESEGRRRVAAFDTLRGFTLLSMVLFHACYDAAYLYGYPLPWFTSGPVQGVWRASISWVFLFLAGWMTAHSRSNIRRAARYGAAALAVWAVTSIASVDAAVNFGILFCMAASTLIYALLQRLFKRAPMLLAAAICLILFAALWHVPRATYDIAGLSWLGFPSPSFRSGDYYPLIPFTFMYLAGAFAARAHQVKSNGRYPAWMCREHCRPLTWIGRRSLAVYLIHQPLLIGLFRLFAS
ncbi:MAG: DUF1624 domain-containing protein [Coriobacteriaceae bacterium]|nr:DUF1624 domain-containing protein [Coriobacteriaceae bacterium]